MKHSPHLNNRGWFDRGFHEGSKVTQAQPSEHLKKVQEQAYELAERQLHVRELQSLLNETTDMLKELQQSLQKSLAPSPAASPSISNNPSFTPTSAASSDSITLGPVSSLSPSFQRVIKSTSNVDSEHVSGLVPGYYTEMEDSSDQRIAHALRSLFDQAQDRSNSQSTSHYHLVKALCQEAHHTPPESRTFAQKYVLHKWRNPGAPQRQSDALLPGSERSGPLMSNPLSTDPPEVWFQYLNLNNTVAWPKGIRANPDWSNAEPIFEDVVASRLFARLKPSSLGELRLEFIAAMIELFTVPGQYRRIVAEEKIAIAGDESYRAFDAGMKTHEGALTVLDVAKHYASCGVSADQVEKCVEPWACQYAKDR